MPSAMADGTRMRSAGAEQRGSQDFMSLFSYSSASASNCTVPFLSAACAGAALCRPLATLCRRLAHCRLFLPLHVVPTAHRSGLVPTSTGVSPGDTQGLAKSRGPAHNERTCTQPKRPSRARLARMLQTPSRVGLAARQLQGGWCTHDCRLSAGKLLIHWWNHRLRLLPPPWPKA